MELSSLLAPYREEFQHYSWNKLRQDALAGITVAAVALPLALAFGIASGATAAVGLVTSIMAAVLMGLLAGAPYQIAGPTAGLVGVLSILAQQNGIQGIWLAGWLAGIILVLMGLLKLGRLIAFLPAPVITGFSSGVSAVLIIAQIDNVFGIQTPIAQSSLNKLLGYFHYPFSLNGYAVILALLVAAIGVSWPKKWASRLPASLAGLIAATGVNILTAWPVAQIGDIPQVFLLPDRFNLQMISWQSITAVFPSAVSIALLCAMESLLCGTVISNISGIPLRPNQELISQGTGNILLPFFGCIPAVSTLVRSSVMVKSGGQTRVAGLVKGATLLLSMYLLAPVISRVPLSALAGVLVVIGWRMNKWDVILAYFTRRNWEALAVFLTTIAVTLVSDLAMGLLAGLVISLLIYLYACVRLRERPFQTTQISAVSLGQDETRIQIFKVHGHIFFGAANRIGPIMAEMRDGCSVILDLQSVRLIDPSGVEVFRKLNEKIQRQGGDVLLAGANKNILTALIKGGMVDNERAHAVFSDINHALTVLGQPLPPG
jgi:SulP family sulfate permease